MRYEGKQLPAWVRLRPRAKPKPMFGPPTKIEHMMERTMAAWCGYLVERVLEDAALVGGVDRTPSAFWRNH